MRSLILLWALDRGNLELFRYLWTFDKFHPVYWGPKNLEFLLVLAYDLATSDLESFYPTSDLLSIILEPRVFSTCLRSFPNMTTAMEFVEDHIVNNHTIDQDVKLKLLLSEEMAPYSFLGTLYPLSMIITEVSEEE